MAPLVSLRRFFFYYFWKRHVLFPEAVDEVLVTRGGCISDMESCHELKRWKLWNFIYGKEHVTETEYTQIVSYASFGEGYRRWEFLEYGAHVNMEHLKEDHCGKSVIRAWLLVPLLHRKLERALACNASVLSGCAHLIICHTPAWIVLLGVCSDPHQGCKIPPGGLQGMAPS